MRRRDPQNKRLFRRLAAGDNGSHGTLAPTCLDVHLHVCDDFRAVPAVVCGGVCLGSGLDFLTLRRFSSNAKCEPWLARHVGQPS